jgi:tRNA (guanine10-N2)-dimethyltransferase
VYGLELAGEDDAFAALEAETAAAGVRAAAPGLALAGSVLPERLRGLAYTRRALRLVARADASVAAAERALAAAPLEREGEGTVAVRARDVRGTAGVDTVAAERALGRVLVDRGFAVDLDDPDRELCALFAAPALDADSFEAGGPGGRVGDGDGDDDDGTPASRDAGVCLLGWTAVESVRGYGARRPTDRPFFQPGSMDPLDARAVANLAGARPGATVLDPMCGTGGVLLEAGLVGARVVGVDAQRKMVRGARENLAATLRDAAAPGVGEVIRGDATRLPIRADAVDGVAFDAPYGRQSKVARHDLADLVGGALAEAARVAPRAVLVADREWRAAARDAGWRVRALHRRRVHRSLARHYHVLEREPCAPGASSASSASDPASEP